MVPERAPRAGRETQGLCAGEPEEGGGIEEEGGGP